MAERKLWINRETLEGIANAIRSKKGTTDLIPVPELETEILSIVAGESSWCGEYVDGTIYKTGAIVSYEGNIYICIKDLDDMQDPTFTEYWQMLNEETVPNLCGIDVTPTKDIQNIVPEGDYDGFDEVIVNPIPDEYVIPNLQEKTATENGEITADEGYTGLSKVTVNVSDEAPTLQEKTIAPKEYTQEVTADEGNDGLSKVTVEAIQTETREVTPTKNTQPITPSEDGKYLTEVIVNPIPEEYIIPIGSLNITENKTVDVTKYASVTVAVEGGGGTDSALPIEVSTEAEMTALLTSGEVGGVYKYTGTTGTYENGTLYVLEEAGYSLTINSAEAYNMGDDTEAYFKINGSASETDYDFKFDGLERSYTFANAEGSVISLPFTIRDIRTLGILCKYGSVTLADTNTNAELIYVSAWNDVNSGELSLDADTSVNIQYDFCD